MPDMEAVRATERRVAELVEMWTVLQDERLDLRTIVLHAISSLEHGTDPLAYLRGDWLKRAREATE